MKEFVRQCRFRVNGALQLIAIARVPIVKIEFSDKLFKEAFRELVFNDSQPWHFYDLRRRHSAETLILGHAV